MTGGQDGSIRVWNILPKTQVLETSLREHKSKITALHVTEDGNQAITSSTDGSTIVWDLDSYNRKICIFSDNALKTLAVLPDATQLINGGVGKRVSLRFKYPFWREVIIDQL